MKKISLLIILLCILIQPVNAQELNCKYTYRNGSKGDNVKVLQEMLNEKENCNLVVDGKFGSKTASCVRKYQKNNNLSVDGVVGKKTCASLNQVEEEIINTVNKIYLVKSNVNFREGPSTSYKSNGILKQNTEVLVLEYTNTNWYKVLYDNKVGYISSKYLTEKVLTPLASNEYIVLPTSVNVRKGPSTSYAKITTAKRGTKVQVTGKSNNWYKVTVNNKKGYIRSDLITKDLIIVDISDQMLYYFKNDETILVTSVVTGMKNRHDTPLGNYTLYTSDKQTNRYLRGYNDDGSKYNAYVNYWMPFNRGVGFHDATWRSLGEFNKNTYVNNGSHGCVNMKKEDAKVLFTNTTTNTAVTVRQ